MSISTQARLFVPIVLGSVVVSSSNAMVEVKPSNLFKAQQSRQEDILLQLKKSAVITHQQFLDFTCRGLSHDQMIIAHHFLDTQRKLATYKNVPPELSSQEPGHAAVSPAQTATISPEEKLRQLLKRGQIQRALDAQKAHETATSWILTALAVTEGIHQTELYVWLGKFARTNNLRTSNLRKIIESSYYRTELLTHAIIAQIYMQNGTAGKIEPHLRSVATLLKKLLPKRPLEPITIIPRPASPTIPPAPVLPTKKSSPRKEKNSSEPTPNHALVEQGAITQAPISLRPKKVTGCFFPMSFLDEDCRTAPGTTGYGNT